MTTKIIKRSIAPPTHPANQKPVSDLKVAVDELSGSIGETKQRAVRLCELLDAGLLSLTAEGLVAASGGNPSQTYVKKAGDTMTGKLVTPAVDVISQTASVGSVRLSPGGAATTGVLEFYTADGTRRGYMGWASGTNFVIQTENTWEMQFNGALGINVAPNTGFPLLVNGAISSTGGGAAIFCRDRTTDRGWAMYGTSDTLNFFNGAANVITIDPTGNHYPSADNVRSSGMAGNRWSVVYAGTGTINTSDARDKTEVREFDQAEISAAKALVREIGLYQWLASINNKGAEHARVHCGMTVQRAIEVMASFGLDPMQYGFICHDSWPEETEIFEQWEATPAVYDPETGMVLEPAKPAGERLERAYRAAGECYSFRTDQLLLFLAAGFEARLTALEDANGPA